MTTSTKYKVGNKFVVIATWSKDRHRIHSFGIGTVVTLTAVISNRNIGHLYSNGEFEQLLTSDQVALCKELSPK